MSFDKIHLITGKIGLVPITQKLLKSYELFPELQSAGSNPLDTFDVTKPLRGKSFAIVYNLLKNPLVELISTNSPSLETINQGALYMCNNDESTKKKKENSERKENHYDSGILWKQEGKMNIKMIVCNFSTQNYKLKNNKLDEGTVIMRRQTWRGAEKEGEEQWQWCKHEYKLIVPSLNYMQSSPSITSTNEEENQNGKNSNSSNSDYVKSSYTLQSSPVIVHYFKIKNRSSPIASNVKKRKLFDDREDADIDSEPYFDLPAPYHHHHLQQQLNSNINSINNINNINNNTTTNVQSSSSFQIPFALNITKRPTPTSVNTNSILSASTPHSSLPSIQSSSIEPHFTSAITSSSSDRDHHNNNNSSNHHDQQPTFSPSSFDLNQINDELTNPLSFPNLLNSSSSSSSVVKNEEEIDSKFSPSNLLENILAEEDNSLYFPMDDDDDPNQIDFLINSNLYSKNNHNSNNNNSNNVFSSSINNNNNTLSLNNHNIQIYPSSPLYRNSNNYYNDDNNNVLLNNIDFKNFNSSVAKVKTYAPDSGPCDEYTKIIIQVEGFSVPEDVNCSYFCNFDNIELPAIEIAPTVFEIFAPPNSKVEIVYFYLFVKSMEFLPRIIQCSDVVPFFPQPVDDTRMLVINFQRLNCNNEKEKAKVVHKFRNTARHLDLSNADLEDIEFLSGMQNLLTLILDNNKLSSTSKFPPLLKLRTLSINNNHIENIEEFIDNIERSLPSLRCLSMLNNDACPYFSEMPHRYYNFRIYVISRLPRIVQLDSTNVSIEERKHAKCISINNNN